MGKLCMQINAKKSSGGPTTHLDSSPPPSVDAASRGPVQLSKKLPRGVGDPFFLVVRSEKGQGGSPPPPEQWNLGGPGAGATPRRGAAGGSQAPGPAASAAASGPGACDQEHEGGGAQGMMAAGGGGNLERPLFVEDGWTQATTFYRMATIFYLEDVSVSELLEHGQRLRLRRLFYYKKRFWMNANK